MTKSKFPFYKGILFRLLLPVIGVGVLMSTLTVSYLSRPMNVFLEEQFHANLRLASRIGVEICESSFNYLLELRLEQNPEMNQTLKQEALEEIKDISTKFPSIHMMVLESASLIRAGSIDGLSGPWEDVLPDGLDDTPFHFSVKGEPARGHVQSFPFWDWHVISFVFEKDYKRPVHMAYRITHLSAAVVFIAVLITLIAVFYLSIKRPLNRLVNATEGVSEGRFRKIDRISRHELGRLMASFNTMVDSLEHEKAEVKSLINQLTESEALFRSQFEYGNIGIAIVSEKQTWIRANNRLCNMLGYSEEELKTMVWAELSHPGDLEQEMPTYNRMIKGEIDTYETERRLFHKNGTMIHTQLNVSCYREKGGTVRFIIGSVLDITDRKKAEEERRKLDIRLLQSQKMEAVGTLAGGIAHDFNNILSSIIGFTQIGIGDIRKDLHLKESLDRVFEAGLRARDLVSHILTFSRQSERRFEVINIGIIIKEVIKLLRAAMPANIGIDLENAGKCCPVYADPVQVHQIIMNLCTNSFHAIGNRNGHIRITMEEADIGPGDFPESGGLNPGRHVKLCVRDNGRGMDRDVLGKIFDPYFTTKKKGEGTGLGLSVVHGIVKKHKGHITAASEPDQGADFLIYLPCAAPGTVPEKHSAEKPIPGGSEHILVVDDEPSITEVCDTFLTRIGYRVTVSNSADAALASFRSDPQGVDLVLTDLTMPEMSGKELASQIRKTAPHIPIVIQTGFIEQVSPEHSELLGVDAVLKKPVLERELAERIRNILDEKNRG